MRAAAFLLALPLAACGGLDREAVVLMLDESYRAQVLLGPGDGIASPDGLAWADGRLWIADEGGSAVRVWSPDAGVRTLADARAGLSSPEDIARAADGTLYVSDDDTGGVWRIATDGRVAHLARGLRSTEGLTLAPDGAVLAGDQQTGAVYTIDSAGAARRLPYAIAKPESLVVAPGGGLFVADNRENILYWRAPGGELHRPIAGRHRFSPESLHAAGGHLLITDSDNGKLYRFSMADGLDTIAVFGGSLANVQGVTSDEAGNIYVSVQSDLAGGRGYILRLTRRRAP